MPALPELPSIEPTEKVLLLPSWFDSLFMTAKCLCTPTVYTIPGGVTVKVALNNPMRWAIGFQDNGPAAANPFIGISTQPLLYGSQATRNLKDCWFNQFVYGPMVQMEWYATSVGGGDITVYEIELQ